MSPDDGHRCLDCGLTFQNDPFHFDCSDDHVCTEAEFQWLSGALGFATSQGQCGQPHEGWWLVEGYCPWCKAAV